MTVLIIGEIHRAVDHRFVARALDSACPAPPLRSPWQLAPHNRASCSAAAARDRPYCRRGHTAAWGPACGPADRTRSRSGSASAAAGQHRDNFRRSRLAPFIHGRHFEVVRRLRIETFKRRGVRRCRRSRACRRRTRNHSSKRRRDIRSPHPLRTNSASGGTHEIVALPAVHSTPRATPSPAAGSRVAGVSLLSTARKYLISP